jgi:hypothetical protein
MIFLLVGFRNVKNLFSGLLWKKIPANTKPQNLGRKIRKMTKFKANIRLVKNSYCPKTGGASLGRI